MATRRLTIPALQDYLAAAEPAPPDDQPPVEPGIDFAGFDEGGPQAAPFVFTPGPAPEMGRWDGAKAAAAAERLLWNRARCYEPSTGRWLLDGEEVPPASV